MAQTVKNLPAMQETWVKTWTRKILWRREWWPTPVFLPGDSHGQRSLAGDSPCGCRAGHEDTLGHFHPVVHWCSLGIVRCPVASESKDKSVKWNKNAVKLKCLYKFSSVQSLSHVRLFATPWTAARQAFLSITNSQSLLKLMSIESVMPSSHLILCHIYHMLISL